MSSLRLAGIVDDSIVDGPGLRLAVFVQGCPHRCPGCHNPQTHDLVNGAEQDARELIEKLAANPLLDGVTLTGGEPVEQAEGLLPLAQTAKDMGKNVWMYSGYTWEQLLARRGQDDALRLLLQYVDILVDGSFVESLKSLSLRFRGSSNQRIIDVPQSLLHPENPPVEATQYYTVL